MEGRWFRLNISRLLFYVGSSANAERGKALSFGFEDVQRREYPRQREE